MKDRRLLIAWLGLICLLIAATVVVGGVTRLTNSGLSITEWRPLMGAIPPWNEEQWQNVFEKYKAIPEYRIENPNLDLSEFKILFLWEYGHRNLGRLIGVVFLIPFLYFLARGKLSRALTTRLLIGFALGGLQGALGWFMVKSGLSGIDVSPVRLAAHLGLAFVIFSHFLGLLFDVLALARFHAVPPPRIRIGANVVRALIGVQILFGALTAGLRAGFSYNTFPTMNGEWIPSALWRLQPLWLNFFVNSATVQFVHRWLGIVVLAGVAWLWISASRTSLPHRQRWPIDLLSLLTIFQFALGVATLVLVTPLPLASAHQLGALALFSAATIVTLSFRREKSTL